MPPPYPPLTHCPFGSRSASLPHSRPRTNVHFFTDRLREPRHSQIFLSLPFFQTPLWALSKSFLWVSCIRGESCTLIVPMVLDRNALWVNSGIHTTIRRTTPTPPRLRRSLPPFSSRARCGVMIRGERRGRIRWVGKAA